MTAEMERAATRRAAEVRSRLRRSRLVFIQFGASFDVLRENFLAELAGTTIRASDFAKGPAAKQVTARSPLILTEIEPFADAGTYDGVSLGEVRLAANDSLDAGEVICIISSVPRIAYRPIPGSSLIEDASPYCVPLLEADEAELDSDPAAILPSWKFAPHEDISQLFHKILRELGVNVLTALDQAIFEARLEASFAEVLDPRVIEALRGAGLVRFHDESGRPTFSIKRRFSEFCDAIADVLASTVEPQPDLSAVVEGLWFIERTIRGRLRAAAIDCNGGRWRRNVLHGELPERVLGRARTDASATAKAVYDLRDPIEWLTLGELLEVVRADRHAYLGLDTIFWQHFEHNVVPIRNRVSHMRTLKKGDKETIQMWVAQIRRVFDTPIVK